MTELNDSALAGRVRTMQIIAFAMMNGVLILSGIFCYLVFGQRGGEPLHQGEQPPIISYVALGLFAIGGVTSFLLPMVVLRSIQRKIVDGTWQAPPGSGAMDDVGKLLNARQTALIIGLALLEGPAFLGCIAFFTEARTYTLAIPASTLILMLLRFPTLDGVRASLQEDLDMLKSLRP